MCADFPLSPEHQEIYRKIFSGPPYPKINWDNICSLLNALNKANLNARNPGRIILEESQDHNQVIIFYEAQHNRDSGPCITIRRKYQKVEARPTTVEKIQDFLALSGFPTKID